ncbi:MAG: formate dehydrogenase subunit gamma [Ramlibacter sp.]|nr:formate dehydrogenase subunit gamma [Ramlibacter sp.]
MTEAFLLARRVLAALSIALLLAPGLRAAVPHEDAVPAYAEEQTILQAEKDTPEPGWFSLASGRNHMDRHYLGNFGRNDAEQELILQRGGNTWRTLRNGPVAVISAVILILTLLGIAGFWRFVGPARVDEPETGRRITRFNAWQRTVHWATAISFLVLAFSGVVILFGKKLLLPWMGHDLFSWLAIISKYLHNVFGPLFILCSLVMFVTFVHHNFFDRGDWTWIKRGGGLVTHEHVPAGYFNAGEKLWFWAGVVLLGLVMSATGLILDFTNLRPTRYLLQWADYLHVAGATFYIAAALGHIYIGTLGTPGAYTAMRRGTVDESWAKAHHLEWYESLRRRGKLPPAAGEPS